MRALIVDDHELFRVGFMLLLKTLASDIELEQAGGVAEALVRLKAQSYELMFLDWWMDKESGAEALESLRCAAPAARLVILSGERSKKVVDLAISKGACGFITKESSTTELTQALQLILQGGIYLPPAFLTSMSTSQNAPSAGRSVSECFPELTRRQADVLRSALRGHSNKEIARELDIAVATVATHLVAIYGAISARNRTEAVFLAAKRGALID